MDIIDIEEQISNLRVAIIAIKRAGSYEGQRYFCELADTALGRLAKLEEHLLETDR